MRTYIRHPTSIPIHITTGGYGVENLALQNLSEGGLCFVTDQAIKIGDFIDFLIPIVKPDYVGTGVVVWRRKQAPKSFEVGLRFTNDDEFFRTRMVEQVCQIEKYRQDIAEKDGRVLNSEEAALEWITKYAKDFAQDEEE